MFQQPGQPSVDGASGRRTAPARRALVLGGGALTGLAWEVGILRGLTERGVDLTGADCVVGTSAGSIVGQRICAGHSPGDMYAEQMAYNITVPGRFGVHKAVRLVMPRLHGAPESARRRIGAISAAMPGDGGAQRDYLAEELGLHEWPPGDLRVAVVDAATGERRTFTRDTGVGLVDAIAASSAFPTVYPPVRIQDRLYLDGSVASLVNADLAVGADRVVVLAPFLLRHVHRRTVEDELATLRPAVRSVVVTADRRCRRIMGGAIFDRARVPATLSAARAQAADVVAAVAPVWQRDAGGVG